MIIIAILIIIVLIFGICLIRTLSLKNTPAKDVKLSTTPDERSTEYAKELSKLIQCETISSRYDESRDKFFGFHKILKETFPNIHKNCEIHIFNGSLLFKWKGKTGADPIMLMSHMDVVEAGGEWKNEPFSGKIEDGLIWGRGTADTKGSLFCLMKSVEELISDGYIPDFDVYIASSCTEEVSGEGAPLTAKFLKENGVKLSLLIDEGGAIIEEPISGVNGTYAMIGVLEKGYGDIKFIAKGAGGHSSAPLKNTPIARLADFISHVEKKQLFNVKFNEPVLEMFKRLAPNMTFGLKFIFANMWLFKPLLTKLLPSISATAGAMIKTTLAFTMAKGSDGLNVIPQEAYVTGNMRFIHHQPTDESIELISNIAKKYDIDSEVIYKDYPCTVVDYTSKQFKLVEEAIHEIFPGVGTSPYVMTGGTDSKFYNEVCDNCIRFAPIYMSNEQMDSIHGLNENIYISALSPAVDFYKYIIKNFK